MPLVSQIFLKTGLIWLLISMGLVAVQHMIGAGWFEGPEAALRILFYHTLTVGWITQIIIGVSIWMFPRYSRVNPRGPDTIWWSVYILLNAGMLIRIGIEPTGVFYHSTFWMLVLITGGWMKAIACLLYVTIIWQRIHNPKLKKTN